MTVLISEVNGSGKRRVCNARCHNAKRPLYKCICKGHYHGAARDETLGQKMRLWQDAILRESGIQLNFAALAKS